MMNTCIQSSDGRLRSKPVELTYTVTVRKGRWDFRFWGFGHFLIGVLAFAFKNWGFSVLVSCGGLRVFSNLLFGFR